MFRRARIKLTAWYLLIIMTISLAFSAVIYRVLTIEIERITRIQRFRSERRELPEEFILPIGPNGVPQPPVTIIDTDLLDDVRHRILFILTMINAGILISSATLGYFLAGRTLQPIKEMMDEQHRFIGDASHELRTPLTSLKSAMEVHMRDRNLTLTDAKKLISESITEVNKLQSLSDGLLQLAQYQKPDGYNRSDKIMISEIVSEAIRKIEPVARQKEISIHYRPATISLRGNKYGLTDLLVILLDNAVKYSHPHSKVSVEASKKEGDIMIRIKDKGIGISREDVPRIFDRFYRADSARSRQFAGGYGLGLSIAKKIVETHHGSISVESTLHKGSIFTVRLPLRFS